MLCCSEVPRLKRVILASGTTASEWSMTEPVMVPKVVCPASSKQLNPEQIRAQIRNIPDDGMRIDFQPLLGIGQPLAYP